MMIDQIYEKLTQLRQKKPLVLCLTNYVTMDFMANSLLALGVAPIMSHEISELEELIKISSVVNLNIGTLDQQSMIRCRTAVEIAKKYGKPIVLDPVGAGASQIRTESAKELMLAASIIRGNASEILALLHNHQKTLGVESTDPVSSAKTIAKAKAAEHNYTIVISGEEDYITNGEHEQSLLVGSTLMPLVTGMGCTLTAVVAAFQAITTDAFTAAVTATAYFGACGSLAAKQSRSPGSFRTFFIDQLHQANIDKMKPYFTK